MPVWHASVALVGISQPVPLVLLTAVQRAEARERALALIDGVGREEIHVEVVPGGAAIHVKRRLAHQEYAQLTDEWCAIPPFDQSGGTVIEVIPGT